MFLPYFIGGILYLNMILGSNNGFSNLTNQIQNLTTNVSTYKDEIISKIEVSHCWILHIIISSIQDTEHLLNHFLIFWPFLNHSDHGSHHLHHEYSEGIYKYQVIKYILHIVNIKLLSHLWKMLKQLKRWDRRCPLYHKINPFLEEKSDFQKPI